MADASFKTAVLFPLDPRLLRIAARMGLRIVHDRRLPAAATITDDRLVINPTYDESIRTQAAAILLADRLLYPPPTRPDRDASLDTRPEKPGRLARIARFLTAIVHVEVEPPATGKVR